MADLLSQFELNKLARILNVDAAALAPLGDATPEGIRELRLAVTSRLFSMHRTQAAALAALSKKVPAPISAKIAEGAFGPVLSARIAGALDAPDAAKLASHLTPDFLARVSRDVDPGRVAAIIQLLPEDLIVKVGHMLLADGDLIALARFVDSVSPEIALSVIAGATGPQLLELALYVDDRAAMDPIMALLSDERLATIVAAEKGFMGASAKDAAAASEALLSALTPATRERWERLAQ